MTALVLLRHGQSVWNRDGLFTGWADVDLSEQGVEEARRAGRLLAAEGLEFDLCHTSVLKRAIRTAHLVLEEMDQSWIPEHKSWRLNERHYGALQGLDKRQVAERAGAAKVRLWRRSWDVAPPPLPADDPRDVRFDRRYADLPDIPRGESLKDTVARVLPYWENEIAPSLRAGARVLIAAHGNSLRGLVKHLEDISDRDIAGLEIPTGVPLLYDLDRGPRPLRRPTLAIGEAPSPEGGRGRDAPTGRRG
ncbi:MAG: 2,3-diphosphoglycerate-dependent phosphoglycerate mutase [Alphaproteobacteria bacterium]|nr:2,3-diphosphoglycerate-dependent phosphoglycerate mutase [Alphaproteobacteria bacterium]